MMTKRQAVAGIFGLTVAVLNLAACGPAGPTAPLATSGPDFVHVPLLDARQPWLGSLGLDGQLLLAMPVVAAGTEEGNEVLASTRVDAGEWSTPETVPGTTGAGVAEAAAVGDGVAVASLTCTVGTEGCLGPAQLNISFRTIDARWQAQSDLDDGEIAKVLSHEGPVSMSLVEVGAATALYARSEDGDSATALIEQDGNGVRLVPIADLPVGLWQQCVTPDGALVSVFSADDQRVTNGLGQSDPGDTGIEDNAVEVEVRTGGKLGNGWETQRGVGVSASDDIGVTCTDVGAVLGTTDKLVKVSDTGEVSAMPTAVIDVPQTASYSSPVASHPGQLVIAADLGTAWITAVGPDASLTHAQVDLGSQDASVDGAAISGDRATLLVRKRTLVKPDPTGHRHDRDEAPRPEVTVTFRILDIQLKDL